MTLIFNRLPEEKKWVRAMSEGQWEDHVMDQLANTSLPIEVQEACNNYTMAFYMDFFQE